MNNYFLDFIKRLYWKLKRKKKQQKETNNMILLNLIKCNLYEFICIQNGET